MINNANVANATVMINSMVLPDSSQLRHASCSNENLIKISTSCKSYTSNTHDLDAELVYLNNRYPLYFRTWGRFLINECASRYQHTILRIKQDQFVTNRTIGIEMMLLTSYDWQYMLLAFILVHQTNSFDITLRYSNISIVKQSKQHAQSISCMTIQCNRENKTKKS